MNILKLCNYYISFLHWFTFAFSLIVLFILSIYSLLTIAVSLLAGFINLHLGLIISIIPLINHTTSFRNKSKERITELSKYIWKFENSSLSYDLKWSIAYKAHLYTHTRKCDLCSWKQFPSHYLTRVTRLFLSADTWRNSHWG